MKNSEYEKMPKRVSDLGLSEKSLNDVSKLKWVVTEKIHGANFSFVYENGKMLFAKRKQYLIWEDDFFGFQKIVVQLEENITRLFEELKLNIKADKYIVYGELFGGIYPHKDVIPDNEVQAIQTGIYYSPNINFCAFDIAYEIDGEKYYIGYDSAVLYFEKFNIFYAKILFCGKLTEVLNFDIKINSIIPKLLNFPEIEPNLIEGIVIKPLNHSTVENLEYRPIIKIKNPEFDEDDKFHESQKWSFIPKITSKTEELYFLTEEISKYINQNRLNSVFSKTGKVDFNNKIRMEEIFNEFLCDVLVDFNINNDNLLNELSEGQKDWLKNRIKARIIEFINNKRSEYNNEK